MNILNKGESVMVNCLTVLIPTHACKRETCGPYARADQKNASAPSTRLIETVISNIKSNITEIPLKFIISLDHKTDVELSTQYLANLKLLEEKCDDIKVTSVDSRYTDNIMPYYTATNNIKHLIDLCPTEYFLFWEHDWIFVKDIDNAILKLWERDDLDLLRLNYQNPTDLGVSVWLENDTWRTNSFSNNPFVTSKTAWYDKFLPWVEEIYLQNYPNSEQDLGGWVETPLSNKLIQLYTEDLEAFRKEYRIGLYITDLEDLPIAHLNGQLWR